MMIHSDSMNLKGNLEADNAWALPGLPGSPLSQLCLPEQESIGRPPCGT